MTPLASPAKLLSSLEDLKISEIRDKVDSRISEFESLKESISKNKSGSTGSRSEKLFSELCFCIMTANFNAEKSIRIQKEIGNGFMDLPRQKLAEKLKQLGHRYPNARADYIAEARKHRISLGKMIKDINSEADEQKLRGWLAENIRGIGYKEASHFLRNVGFKKSAIIDFHIIDLLVKHGLIKEPKTLTRARYMEIEGILRGIAEKAGLNLAELDLYLWYMETGKILK